MKGDIELREEGKMADLFGHGSSQWFVVNEEGGRAAGKKNTEMFKLKKGSLRVLC